MDTVMHSGRNRERSSSNRRSRSKVSRKDKESDGSFRLNDYVLDMSNGRTSTMKKVSDRTTSNSPRRGRRRSKGKYNNESSSQNLLVRLARSMSPGTNKKKIQLRAARGNNNATKRKQKKDGSRINSRLDQSADDILQNEFNSSEFRFLEVFDWDEDKKLDDKQVLAMQKMVREFELIET